MLPTRQGSIRLFRVAGIDVFLHWLWFLAPVYIVTLGGKRYSSLVWNVLEVLCLFAIVLMHEFGHALACRQVGGKADYIILWPLGGVAYVAPPQRPGATLWSIAAGPLVNVVLAPFFTVLYILARQFGWEDALPDLYRFVESIWIVNFVLLFFNLLPIYPLDGGQILRALLWFFIGKGRSLMVASIIGFIGVPVVMIAAIFGHSASLGVMAVFIMFNCWRGLLQARMIAKMAKLPRRTEFACPSCKQPPIAGPFWICHRCRARFDTFETNAICPNCGEEFPMTRCLECGEAHPMPDWRAAGYAPTPPPLP